MLYHHVRKLVKHTSKPAQEPELEAFKHYSVFYKVGSSATPQLKPKHRQFITECFM